MTLFDLVYGTGRGPLLETAGDSGSGGAGGGEGSGNSDTSGSKDGGDGAGGASLSDSGKRALDAERERAKEAERRAKAAEKELADRKAADDAAKEEAARKNGEFESLATSLKSERDELKTKLDAAEQRATRLQEAVDGFVKAEWEAIPQDVRDLYTGADDDPLAKLAFVPKAKKLADKLGGGGKAQSKGVNTADPKSGGGATGTKADDPKKKSAQSFSLRNF